MTIIIDTKYEATCNGMDFSLFNMAFINEIKYFIYDLNIYFIYINHLDNE